MRTYREIFAVREFRVLFLARCVTIASVSLGSLALGATVYDATGSPVLTALAMFGGPLITLVGSATMLGASDSLGPRRAAIQMPLAYAVANAFQVIPGLPWGVRFVLLAAPFVVGSATSGSVMRLVSLMLPTDGIVLGRATLNVAVGVMQVVGFAAGGLLLAAFSPS
ncbi:MAG: rane protein, partial [Nocardioidaceae bacterium]|nr:rane protein [Nocardioidaceae bacterium]